MTLATLDTLAVSEVFGPTFQGEGPSAGRRASFIRLGGCNLACKWCDTGYTWDAGNYDLRKEISRWHVDSILERVFGHHTDLVVITGGEPLLQQHHRGFAELVRELDRADKSIEIETNGTITPVYNFVRYNVSPKLANAGMPRSINDDALKYFVYYGAVFKFVVSRPEDLDEVAEIAAEHRIPAGRIWIMPQGTRPTALMLKARMLAEPVLARGYNMTMRQHVLLWGDQRGR